VNRRGFFRSLIGGAAAAVVLDPEKLLWVPGKKVISIPAPTIDGISIYEELHYPDDMFAEMDRLTLERVREPLLKWYLGLDDSPLLKKLRSRECTQNG